MNIFKIKTPDKGWCDKDLVVRNASFQMLTDCIEYEKLHEMTDWEHNDEYKQAKSDIDLHPNKKK